MNSSNIKILITGGSGLLSKHIKIEGDKPSSKELDITKEFDAKPYDLIIHLAAYTNVEKAETEKYKCFAINALGTINLLEKYPNTPFVYLSTEYAYKPVNFYSVSKNIAEQLVALHPNYLIIRTLFKRRPWPYDKAFMDKFTMGDYVDVIGEKITEEIKTWIKQGYQSRLVYIGTGRKSYFDLARASRPDVMPNSIKEVKGVKIPKDYK